ncbi:trypsin-like peptidase domain-containing protein [Pedobacter polaris]|uniref:Trypsin-like peptidase domain-containing protein n=1 Tax=Pedobacter polaris TaxID=2571273 RepID=A0A4U1CHH9_9SPHI|nr:serine protease [Pedobacter polaris]TKC06755.1 trypsin-like peptidase domain-containing protein [Pedobacter polaris]
MRNEIELEAIIEDYLKGKLTADEQKAFEQLRANDPVVDHKVVAHKVFLESMQQYADILLLKEQMDAAHQHIDVAALSAQVKPHPSRIVRIWRNNKSAIAVAASFLILAMIMLYSIQSQKKQVGDMQLLAGKVSDIKGSQDIIVRTINGDNRRKSTDATPAKFGGTGFAISSNGYILTSYHVINGKGSIYVQNSKGVTYKVVRYYTDPVNDIAILKISDDAFTNLGSLPYSIKKGVARIGDAVYTLGYPKDDVVLGDGYVSSRTGLNGDTIAYQVAIPVNPGNSGGPLLDNNGNIVGVINGKENKTEGAAFAVKSKYIMEALNAIPQDSLSKRVAYGKRSSLQGLKRNQQVQKMQDYVFNIKVY